MEGFGQLPGGGGGEIITGYYGDKRDAVSALLTHPTGIAVSNSSGDVYVADFGNHFIRVLAHTCFNISRTDHQNVCSGHGLCVDMDTCSCETGYFGADCSIVEECYGVLSNDDSVCSGNGICSSNDNCTCYSGFENFICSDVKCGEGICPTIQVVEERNVTMCSVPIFSLRFPNIEVLNITWSLYRLESGHPVETMTLNDSSITSNYTPSVSKMFNGNYSVIVDMYYQTKMGEIRSRTASRDIRAVCSVCDHLEPHNNDRCRFKIGFNTTHGTVIDSSVIHIPRMKWFRVVLVDQDSLNNDAPIEELEVNWTYHALSSPLPQSINIEHQDRELTISPTDSASGMTPDVTIRITCQRTLSGHKLDDISLDVYVTPSRNITPDNASPLAIGPSSGYTLLTQFLLQATKPWDTPHLIYTFSFISPVDHVHIRLDQTTNSSISSTLPLGSPQDSRLLVRLQVYDTITGDFGSTEQMVTVRPYFGGGLLRKLVNEIIDRGGDHREMISVASQVSVASTSELKQYHDDLTFIVNITLN